MNDITSGTTNGSIDLKTSHNTTITERECRECGETFAAVLQTSVLCHDCRPDEPAEIKLRVEAIGPEPLMEFGPLSHDHPDEK